MDLHSMIGHMKKELGDDPSTVKEIGELEVRPTEAGELRVVRRTDDGSCRWGCGKRFGTLWEDHKKRREHEAGSARRGRRMP